MFFLRKISVFITILIFPFLVSAQPEADVCIRKTWRLQKIDKPMRFPSDIAFFNSENKKNFIEDFEGKTILVVFWATWCAPCRAEMLELDVLKKDFRKLPLEIVPISQDYQGVAIVKKFYEENEIRHLPVYHDYKNELFRELGIAGLPTCYILDSDGLIKAIITGTMSWHEDSLRELLLEFIEGNPVTPKNSYKDNSLNQHIKKQTELKEENTDKPDSKEKLENEKSEDKSLKNEKEKNATKNDS